jgi:hypothetical protein
MTPEAPLAPRNVAKFVVTTTIHVAVASPVRSAIADRTSASSTDIPVVVAGALVGYYASNAVKPLTDKMVDKTADFVNAKREARKARRSEKTENE